MSLLGHKLLGHGDQRVLVLHDWMGDHGNYDPMVPYLDQSAFTYAFVDLRGYGLSRHVTGDYTLTEASADALAVADQLQWGSFHLVGHSMSSLVAQQIAADNPDRLASLILLTPVAPGGMGAPDEVVEFLQQAGADEAFRREHLAAHWGDRLSRRWFDFKMDRWAEAAAPGASRGYVSMFAREKVRGSPASAVPALAIVGGGDQEPFTETTVRGGLGDVYTHLTVCVYDVAGHYPMQEVPVMLATDIEKFARSHHHG